ncbi:MAG TPA: phosphopantetheine-binding protein [Thermoanaerobaculia bacterium]|nr:phosphopantetheine-binding protein [Thermoanaerobaculia bacterium]
MNEPELEPIVLGALRRVAPEADPSRIDPKESLRDQLDIDSMHFLNFLIAIHEALGVDIPEADYPRLSTLQAILEYLAQKKPGPAPS